MVRSAALLSLLLLPACQTASPPEPTRNDSVNEAVLRLSAQTLDALNASSTWREVPESPAMTELLGRLSRLCDALERGPANDTRPAPADASARRDAADSATLQALQQALLLSERQRDLLLQNIANVNAPAYQRCSLQLTTTLDACTGLVLPIASVERRNETTGVLEITDRNLDIAIDGLGWFVVRHPHGPQLTRDGSFLINAEGYLVTASGSVLEPGITIPNDTLEIAIDPEGRMHVRTASKPDQSRALGQLVLARPLDSSQLRPMADGEFTLAADACPLQFGVPGDPSFGLLKQGFLERSNVQLLQELLELQQCERTMRAVRRVLAEYGVFTR